MQKFFQWQEKPTVYRIWDDDKDDEKYVLEPAEESIPADREQVDHQLSDTENVTNEYEIQGIENYLEQVSLDNNRMEKLYLVKWKGYDERTWIKESEIDADRLIQEFWKKKKDIPKSQEGEKLPTNNVIPTARRKEALIMLRPAKNDNSTQ